VLAVGGRSVLAMLEDEVLALVLPPPPSSPCPVLRTFHVPHEQAALHAPPTLSHRCSHAPPSPCLRPKRGVRAPLLRSPCALSPRAPTRAAAAAGPRRGRDERLATPFPARRGRRRRSSLQGDARAQSRPGRSSPPGAGQRGALAGPPWCGALAGAHELRFVRTTGLRRLARQGWRRAAPTAHRARVGARRGARGTLGRGGSLGRGVGARVHVPGRGRRVVSPGPRIGRLLP
jgi:hypothetical protein